MTREHRLGFVVALTLLLGATAAHATINVNPSPVNAGTAATGTTVTKSFTISSTNNAKVDLSIGGCTSGAGMPFSIDQTTNINLNGGNTANLVLSFMPTVSGSQMCTVTVYDTGTTTSLGTFVVSGTGQNPPMISVTAPGTFPAVRFFDNAVAAHTSTRSITISNGGDATLNISSFSFSNSEFSFTPAISSDTIAGKNSKSYTIQFNPSAAGAPRTGVLTIQSNAMGAGTTTVNLGGDGQTGILQVTGNGSFSTVATGSSKNLDQILSNTGGTPKGILSVTRAWISNASNNNTWFKVTNCGTADCFSTMSPLVVENRYPSVSGVSPSIVGVSCSPPSGTSTETATLNIQADTDGSSGPSYLTTYTVNLSCTAGSSLLAFDAAQFDFGSVLVGQKVTSTGTTFKLKNSGTTDASIYFTSGSVAAGRFKITGPNGCGAQATPCMVLKKDVNNVPGEIALTFEFTPDAEASFAATFDVNGAGAAPSLTLVGKGIDRHIVLPDVVQFPDTFRNPSSDRPECTAIHPVTVQNSGEYMLHVDSLAVGPDNITWQIVEPAGAFDVPGGGSQDILVKFAPQVAGKADDAILHVNNDDTKVASGMPIVVLSGNGKDRNVDMMPSSVSAGETFAGVPVLLSEVLSADQLPLIVNNETDVCGDFKITKLEITGPDADAFEVRGVTVGMTLNRGDMIPVDILFKPSRVGDLQAQLDLYLDGDDVAQKSIPLSGRALWVSAHGSGCSTGRDTRGAMILVLGTLLIVLRRRRR